MGKARDLVRMDQDEIAEFLTEKRTLQVATLDRDGAPHLTALWFAVEGGAILFETYGKSQKVLNLRRDPRIAVQVEAGDTYGELRGVSIQGHAEIVETEPELSRLMALLIAHHFPEKSADDCEAMTAQMVRKRVVVRVHADRTMSWDHRKLGPDAAP